MSNSSEKKRKGDWTNLIYILSFKSCECFLKHIRMFKKIPREILNFDKEQIYIEIIQNIENSK